MIRTSTLRHVVATAALLTAFTGVTTASAQAIDGEFSVQRFNPAPGPRNFFTTRGARTDGEMAWSAGLFGNFALNPFTVRSCVSSSDCDNPNAQQKEDLKVIETMVSADLMASLTIIPRLQLGLRVPVTYVNGNGITEQGTEDPAGIDAFGMGDAEIEAKARLVGEVKDPFVVGAALFATGPLGSATAENKFIGDSSPTAGIRAIFDGSSGPFSVGGNLSANYRGEGRVGSTDLGPFEFRYGVAAGFKVSPVIRLVADGFGATKFSARNGTNTLEVDGGAQIQPLDSPFVISLGAGTGVIQGVGVPQVRAFLGVMYIHEASDRDNDGILDNSDQCPTDPEDKDGYEDSDGCPDKDNDGDTIADDADKCPLKAEDPDGFEDTDGCPDPDNDGDGVVDDRDRCPEKKETKNGFKDEDGCPDAPDSDGDGVPDEKDQCPQEAEDTDGNEDTDGCPDPDDDGDGVPDEKDECPEKSETLNGFEDEDGCPDVAPKKAGKGPAKPTVKVTKTAIVITDKINFATGSSRIVGKRSFQILDAVADVLKKFADIKSLEVAGHTDSRGNKKRNQKLSEKRAAAVKDYLVKKRGIEAGRLESAGYGQTQPLADNKSKAGREKNRRVEFKILKRGK